MLSCVWAGGFLLGWPSVCFGNFADICANSLLPSCPALLVTHPRPSLVFTTEAIREAYYGTNGACSCDGSAVGHPSFLPKTSPPSKQVNCSIYTTVERKAVSIQVDNYSAGFCILYKAEARVGGATTCPNAARLLRIR